MRSILNILFSFFLLSLFFPPLVLFSKEPVLPPSQLKTEKDYCAIFDLENTEIPMLIQLLEDDQLCESQENFRYYEYSPSFLSERQAKLLTTIFFYTSPPNQGKHSPLLYSMGEENFSGLCNPDFLDNLPEEVDREILLKKIEDIQNIYLQSEANAVTVNFIGHSLGAIVAAEYGFSKENWEGNRTVNKVVFLAERKNISDLISTSFCPYHDPMNSTYTNDLGDSCIVLANHLQRPFWYFEQNIHYYLGNPLNDPILMTIDVVPKRIFLGLVNLGCLTLTLPCAFLSFPIKGFGNYLQSKEFIYWKGTGREIPSPTIHKITHLNACMLPGGLPYLFGKMRTAGERIEQLGKFIRTIDPDLFFLCEFSATLSNKLYELFSDQYTHFFVNIGPSACGMDSSMAVVSRIPVLYAHFFPSNSIAEREQKLSYRGYFLVETEKVNYLYVHLHPKETKRAKEIRLEQLQEITEIIKNNKSNKPFVIIGDLNIDRETTNYIKMTDEMGFLDPLYEEYGAVETEKNGRSVDGILTLKEEGLKIEISINETYEDNTPSLSDHKGITANISW